jgi:hypothetical protein
MQPTEQASWATVAVESFEFNMIPWAGRRYAEWLRAWSRPHPGDPKGLKQVPAQMYALFQKRTPGERLTREQAKELGYPGVPGERELDEVRRELHDALGRSDWAQAHDLDMRLRDLQDRVAEVRATALRPATARP